MHFTKIVAAALAVASASLLAQPSESIERGAYLAQASDCVACHTVKNGAENAGGLAFETPMGTVYSTNITSDKTHGIGNYSYEEFTRAVREGVAPHGNLYPAMPYTSYSLMNDKDVRALFDYYKTVKPIAQPNLANDMMFPFNIRFGLKAWNLVSHDAVVFQPEAAKSDSWNRGSYLVNGPGHCGECHTPRGLTMAMDQSRHFQGEIIEGIESPDITSAELARQNWTHEDLSDLLRHGQSRKGTVFGGMFPVVYHSFSHLTTEDMRAVSTYLLDNDDDVVEQAAAPVVHDKDLPGYKLYKGYCAGCHAQKGEGREEVAPALISNATVDRTSAHNAIYVVLQGVPNQRFSLTNALYAMPGAADSMTDQQVADLVNYMRHTWTSQASDVTVAEVADVRALVEQSNGHAAH